MVEKKLSRKDREFRTRRQEIMDTALDLFSEKGFQNVTMQEIAKASEFAVGTLYKFFDNKEDLYRAIILEKTEEFYLTLTDALGNARDEIEGIKTYIETRISFFMANLKFVNLYVAETRGPGWNTRSGLDKALKEEYEKIILKLAEIFRIGIKKRLFKDFDPYLLAIGLDCLTLGFLFLNVDLPGQHHFNADLIMRVFLGPIFEDKRQGSRPLGSVLGAPG
jgi:TetR/AcrR family transcriptional regulator